MPFSLGEKWKLLLPVRPDVDVVLVPCTGTCYQGYDDLVGAFAENLVERIVIASVKDVGPHAEACVLQFAAETLGVVKGLAPAVLVFVEVDAVVPIYSPVERYSA